MGSVGKYTPNPPTSISSRFRLSGTAATSKSSRTSNRVNAIQTPAKANGSKASHGNSAYMPTATAAAKDAVAINGHCERIAAKTYAFGASFKFSAANMASKAKTKVLATLITTISQRIGLDFLSAGAA